MAFSGRKMARKHNKTQIRRRGSLTGKFQHMSIRLQDNKHGKFFGPSQVFMGYVFLGCGIFCSVYSLTILLLIIPGAFMAFTTTGTIIDFENKKIKPYTTLFGFIRTGKWANISQFSGFRIMKINRRYTTYSRANIPLDMNKCTIDLVLTKKGKPGFVLIKKHSRFEEARKELDDLKTSLMSSNNISES